MKKSDFYYDLPEELIAQTPVEPRNSSRLMKIDRKTGDIVHSRFYNLCDYLKKVIYWYSMIQEYCRQDFTVKKKSTGSFIEFLLLEQKGDKLWEIICRPGKKAKVGTEFSFGERYTNCKKLLK